MPALDVADGPLHHEVRGSGPLLVLLGSPMDADAFAPLADLLAVDHTVLTTDPRGIHRSPLHDPEQDSTPELRAGDALGAWKRFLDIGNLDVPAEVMVAHEPRQIADERRWFLHEMRGTVGFRPDPDALGAVDVVVGIGEESAGEICDRTSRALARLLGVEPVLFPGGHIGFAEDPAAFVPRLREVLGGTR